MVKTWKSSLRVEITIKEIYDFCMISAGLGAYSGSALLRSGGLSDEGWNVTDYCSYKLCNSNDTPIKKQGAGEEGEGHFFSYFLESALEFSHLSLCITIDISIFICLES